MIKAIFLDIDGTLVSFKTHEIPASTVEALTLAKQKGIKIFIATGRPPQIITNLGSITHLIDGYMTTNGAYCYIGQQTVRLTSISPSDVAFAMQQFAQWNAAVVVVGKDGMALHHRNALYDALFQEMLDIDNIYEDPTMVEHLLQGPVTQLTPFITPEQEASLMPHLPSCTSGRWHSQFTDITSCEADKGLGLEAMANALGIALEETMAFGDGGNDMTIIRKAGIGVAMGNAWDELKAEADYVTESVDDDGIINALRHFNLI